MGGTTETRPATGSQGTASGSCHRRSRRSPSSSRGRRARRLPAIACRGAPGHARADRNHLGPLPSKKNSPRTLQAREALRSVIASLDQRYREQVHDVETVPLIVREPPEACAVCGGRMNVQKTIQRWGKTLAHGLFRVRETIYACASRRKKGHRVVTARSSFLAQLLLPHSTVGYDLLVYVGCQRFVYYRQREEMRAELKERYGIVLSTGEISALGRRFLVYLEALHQKQSPALRAALEADGGWPLHIDATGEDGRGTLVTAWASWRGWVLSAWKAPTERTEFILPGIQRVAAEFGAPCAILRDLGRAMTEAAAQYVQSLKKPIPVLACHQHFLSDIGKDLLEAGHHQLRDGFRQIRLLPRLRAFVRQQGSHLGESIGRGREALDHWLAAKGHTPALPKGVEGIVAVRSMAQWALDYHADGRGLGFPFDLAWLDLSARCLHLLAALRTFLRTPPADAQVLKALETLERMLRPLERTSLLSSCFWRLFPNAPICFTVCARFSGSKRKTPRRRSSTRSERRSKASRLRCAGSAPSAGGPKTRARPST